MSGWLVGLILAVLAVLLAKRKESRWEKIYLRTFDALEDRGYLAIRRRDMMPVDLTRGAEKLLGISLAELKADIVRLNGCFQEQGKDGFWETYRNWDGKQLAQRFRKKDGAWVYFSVMRSKDGEFDLLFWRDATEDAQKEAESQQTIARLEEAGRSKTSFFSRMSHEIRTPMNGITGMLSLAEGKLSEDSPAMEYLHRADALAAHMLGLLNDILSISRIEANKVELEKKPLSLRRLGDLLRGILLLLLRRSFRRADVLERAKRAEKVLFALLTAKGVQAGLGWNTELLDAWLAETFPKVQPGEYTRVCELLEKSVYGDIPPEIYEERTIFALLRKLRGLPAGSGFRAQLRSRYGWIPAAVR